jgi:hypothetical protein
LVFEGDGGACLPAALPPGLQGRIRAFSFGSGQEGNKGVPFYFTPSLLQLVLTDGSRVSVRPYEGWNNR